MPLLIVLGLGASASETLGISLVILFLQLLLTEGAGLQPDNLLGLVGPGPRRSSRASGD